MQTETDSKAISGNAARNLAHIIHELQIPMVALRGSLDFAAHELKSRGVTLSEDWLADAWQWTELMVRMLQNAQIVVASEIGVNTVRIARLSFLENVVNPAIRGASILFRERRLSPTVVALHGLDMIPPLYADAALLTQLIFNLLSNSLKYGGREPTIEIRAERAQSGCRVKFRDWGIGVPTSEVPTIFSAGFRSQNAVSQSAGGTGMGLFIAREIMRQHGGSIELTHSHNPTEFSLFFPERLFRSPITEQSQ